jgi:hypothetical protein
MLKFNDSSAALVVVQNLSSGSSVVDEGKRKSPLCIFLAVVQFVLQLCHVFCSCAFCLADVLKLCIIPTYNFADVQMK